MQNWFSKLLSRKVCEPWRISQEGLWHCRKAPSAPDLLCSLWAHSPSRTSSWLSPPQGNDVFPTAQETVLRYPKGTQAKQGHQHMIFGSTFAIGLECLTTAEEAAACKEDRWQRNKKIREKQQLQTHCAARKVNYATELEAVALHNGNWFLHHEGTGCIWRLNLVLCLGSSRLILWLQTHFLME